MYAIYTREVCVFLIIGQKNVVKGGFVARTKTGEIAFCALSISGMRKE
jgi:hypothetical protein